MVSVKEIESYKDYGKCAVISNGVIEAYVTLDLGPRIIRFGFLGGQNIMNDDRKASGERTSEEYEKFFGKGRKWENMGGHRIWISPESYPETYTPDDRPLEYKVTENGALFIPLSDTELGISKTMEIKMDSDDANMQVIMSVKNCSEKEKDFAVWSLSVCAGGGELIIPMNTDNTGLLPNRVISVWPYTDLSDSRIHFGRKYACLKQKPGAKTDIKLGFDSKNAVGYYLLGDNVFCKRYDSNHPLGKYPDGGCSFETFTNGCMLEFETLSELKTVKPGETATHTESWSLYKKPCEVDTESDDSIDNLISKL